MRRERNELLIELSETMRQFVKNLKLQNGKEDQSEIQALFGETVTPALKQVLMVIGSEPTSNIKQLAKMLQITSGAVTQQVAALEKLGALERTMSDQDRREVLITVTPKGFKIYRQLREHMLKMLDSAFSTLTDDELDQFVQLMTKANTKQVKEHMA
jgi:DNA-binding MarR family transcriptional regulator